MFGSGSFCDNIVELQLALSSLFWGIKIALAVAHIWNCSLHKQMPTSMPTSMSCHLVSRLFSWKSCVARSYCSRPWWKRWVRVCVSLLCMLDLNLVLLFGTNTTTAYGMNASANFKSKCSHTHTRAHKLAPRESIQGTAVVFDNRRVLHGRLAFSGTTRSMYVLKCPPSLWHY